MMKTKHMKNKAVAEDDGQKYTWIENPEPDERSKEEQEIADACAILMERKVVMVIVGGEPPGTPSRIIGVVLGFLPWHHFLFKRRHGAIVKAVQSMVQADAQVKVLAMPLRILLPLIYRGALTPKGPYRCTT